jgi:hypothetical protein
MVKGLTVTSSLRKSGSKAVAVAGGTGVGGTVVFVGRGAGLLVGPTATDISQARLTRINRERSNKILFMVEFPFAPYDSDLE